MIDLYSVAMSYIGTPHINGGNIKGAGLDCCTLIAQIYKEWLGVDIPIEFGYSADWFCRRDCEEILLPYLEKYFEQINTIEPGDIISYRWGHAKYAHLAMYIESNTVVHCQADVGVEFTDLDNPYFISGRKSRATGIWRLRNEFI